MKVIKLKHAIFRMFRAGGFLRIWHEFYENYLFDFINKTDTHTRTSINEYDRNTPYLKNAYEYMPSYSQTIKQSLKKVIRLNREVIKYNLIDIGCGKGKILLIAHRLGFKKAVGFEINKSLSRIALDNLKIMKLNKNFKIINANAVNESILPDFSLCYFYNPFDKNMSKKIFKLFEKKKTKNQKYLIYVNPIYHFLLKKNWELIEKFKIGTQVVQIWRCKI